MKNPDQYKSLQQKQSIPLFTFLISSLLAHTISKVIRNSIWIKKKKFNIWRLYRILDLYLSHPQPSPNAAYPEEPTPNTNPAQLLRKLPQIQSSKFGIYWAHFKHPNQLWCILSKPSGSRKLRSSWAWALLEQSCTQVVNLVHLARILPSSVLLCMHSKSVYTAEQEPWHMALLPQGAGSLPAEAENKEANWTPFHLLSLLCFFC